MQCNVAEFASYDDECLSLAGRKAFGEMMSHDRDNTLYHINIGRAGELDKGFLRVSARGSRKMLKSYFRDGD